MLDRLFHWKSKTSESNECMCRFRLLESKEIGPIAMIVNVKENAGPGVERALDELIPNLLELEAVRGLEDFDDFDSVLWFLGQTTGCGRYLFRIRETEAGFRVDRFSPLPLTAFQPLESWQAIQYLFEHDE